MRFCFNLMFEHSKPNIINKVIDVTKRNGLIQVGIFISLKFRLECHGDKTFYGRNLLSIHLLKINILQI